LAEVASDAQVALGNVYYYFKAKYDLIVAISDQRTGGIENLIARLETISAPCERLEGLVHARSTIVISTPFTDVPSAVSASKSQGRAGR
jgi:AcrR family transcriptional regulator